MFLGVDLMRLYFLEHMNDMCEHFCVSALAEEVLYSV